MRCSFIMLVYGAAAGPNTLIYIALHGAQVLSKQRQVSENKALIKAADHGQVNLVVNRL